MPSLSKIAKHRPPSGAAKLRSDLAAWSTSLIKTSRRVASSTIHWGRSSAGGSFASGCVAAWYAIGFVHPLSARFGTSLLFQAGAITAAILALLATAIAAGRGAQGWRRRTTILCLFVAVWAIANGRLSELAGFGYRSLSLDSLSRAPVQFGMALATSLVLLGVPVAAATSLILGTPSACRGWLLSGAALGLVVATQLIGPLLGVQWDLWVAAVCSLMIVATRHRSGDSTQEEMLGSANPLWTLFGSLAVGIAAAALGRLILQLRPRQKPLNGPIGPVFSQVLRPAWSCRVARQANAGNRQLPGCCWPARLARCCRSPALDFSPIGRLLRRPAFRRSPGCI